MLGSCIGIGRQIAQATTRRRRTTVCYNRTPPTVAAPVTITVTTNVTTITVMPMPMLAWRCSASRRAFGTNTNATQPHQQSMVVPQSRFGGTYADGDEHCGIILPRTKWPTRVHTPSNNNGNDHHHHDSRGVSASTSSISSSTPVVSCMANESVDNRTISCIGFGGRIRAPWLPGLLQPAIQQYLSMEGNFVDLRDELQPHRPIDDELSWALHHQPERRNDMFVVTSVLLPNIEQYAPNAPTELAPKIDAMWTKSTPAALPPAGVRIDSPRTITTPINHSSPSSSQPISLIDSRLEMASRLNPLAARLEKIGNIDCVFVTGIDYLARSDRYRHKMNELLYHAFVGLEAAVASGRILSYGVSSSLFGVPSHDTHHVSLQSIIAMAQRVGGVGHHMRAIRFGTNLLEPGVFTERNQMNNTITTADYARDNGIALINDRVHDAEHAHSRDTVRLFSFPKLSNPEHHTKQLATSWNAMLALEESYQSIFKQAQGKYNLVDSQFVQWASVIFSKEHRDMFYNPVRWEYLLHQTLRPAVYGASRAAFNVGHETPEQQWAFHYRPAALRLFDLYGAMIQHTASFHTHDIDQYITQQCPQLARWPTLQDKALLVALSIGSHVTLTDQSSLVHDLLHVMTRESTAPISSSSLKGGVRGGGHVESSSNVRVTSNNNSHVLAPYLLARDDAISLMASCAARFPILSLLKKG